MSELIRIDGSQGEGGGQILRTSLSLSLLTGKPFRIERIRAGRGKPGLLRQHLTAVLAAAEVGTATVEGASLGSPDLTFTPGFVRAGEYRFAVGTAGSGTLVFQTILPALMMASAPSRVVIEGGTHNMAAPPFDFLRKTFVPLVERMGPKVKLQFERYGFYPAGGGRFIAQIEPARALTPFHLGERGPVTSRRIHAVVANLSRKIAEREVHTAAGILTWGPETHDIKVTRESSGPGNVLMIEIETAEVTELFTTFGQLGVSAEKVAGETLAEVGPAQRGIECEFAVSKSREAVRNGVDGKRNGPAIHGVGVEPRLERELGRNIGVAVTGHDRPRAHVG